MLTKRLEAIFKYINKEDTVADIGTDHGYLLKACLDSGLSFVQGVENKKGPYLRAESNLIDYLNDKKAILTLSDGLSLLDSRINTVVIAGMGGELIRDIINDNLNKAKNLNKLILEPNIKSYELRQFLNTHNFEILDEEVVIDNDKYYEIIITKFNNNSKVLTDIECFFGPILLKNKSNLFVKKWEEKLNQLKEICLNSDKKLYNIEKQIKMIEEAIYD